MGPLDASSRDEAGRIDDVVNRLRHRFPHLPPEHVSTVVRESHRELDEAVVRDFVPILVEKRAREILQARSWIPVS